MRKSFLVLFAVALVAVGLMAAGASAQHPGEEPPGEPDPTPSFAADGILVNAFFARSSPATQSDFAFKGGLMIAGNYNGFRIFDISKPKHPRLVKDVFCRGQ